MEQPLTAMIPSDRSALSLAEYERHGGYRGLRRTLSQYSPEDALEIVKSSRLRGRGGAGFPTALKWSFVPKEYPGPTYLIANADEMEPGTFKDRLLLESTAHQLIEGMILAAYCIGADTGYIFLRGEYTRAARNILRALDEACEAGILGSNILDSGFSFDLYLHTGAGRYICGEETALINALEGRRAHPRAKPPFPQVSGLFGHPTVVNNTETLCNIPHILANGAEWYQDLGRGDDSGTKLFSAAGRVRNPGVWELPMGTPIHEILEDHAGGMAEGFSLRAFQPGGASTDFLLPEDLNLRMDYDAIGKAGSRMGTGALIVLDDQSCPVGMVKNLSQFFARESCGWCTPCRDGLPWMVQLLDQIEQGQGQMSDLDTLAWQCRFMGPGNTFCALAPGAAEPVQSALRLFRDEFEHHINQGRCPYGA
ncbi:NADH-quinone oxidoreductase subunit NuoF [Marinobacterium jannaschii]|uniref:NADH-quinone oxidoreductase subunit NuoF n=1 Tax=Marinobacterium jannaschii TaxID=64970 RepID=UPI000484F15E|nr:NADH-quinone oxidoreductase subunit NuoF [Marinobacterium jannaschii]